MPDVPVTAQRGTQLRCRTWRAEALLRLLENVLEVGERPQDLVVYAALGKAVKDWTAYHQIVAALHNLDEDHTLVLQTGRPVAVLRTHPAAPMVVSAVNNTVGQWATEETFYRRLAEGKTIWGGLTAAAWQYIGRQGVLGGTYELFRAALQRHFDETQAPHRWVLTAGLGGMGSSQPISARMLQLSSITVEIDPAKLDKLRLAGGLDVVLSDPAEALRAVTTSTAKRQPLAVGLLGNAAEVYPKLLALGARPDLVTDQTAAHDARYGYVPAGYDLTDWVTARETQPGRVEADARTSMAEQLRAMLAFQAAGAVVFENGNNLRVQAARAMPEAEATEALARIPGFMEAYLRPLFSQGIGPFRWIVLSGDQRDLDLIDELAAAMFPQRPEVARWIELARTHVPPQGLPARSCWLGYGERSALAVAVNEAVADGRLSAPVAFSRDHLDSAAMTHPRIGTEGMLDDSDGVSDWPLLDAMLLSAGGADLVAVHSGGGGYSGWMQSAGVTVVADGSASATQRLRLALDLDSGLGVARHAVAGYREGIEAAQRSHLTGALGAPIELFDN